MSNAKSSFTVDVSGREHLEEWRPALDFEGLYEVSDFGRVRRAETHRLMSLRTLNNGYVIVMMCKNGQYQNQSVHRLVLKAFVGRPAPGIQCRHLNGVRTDNRLENLKWGTVSENSVDQVNHGTHRNIRKTHCDSGHEFTPENTYVRPNGSRNCRACKKISDAAYYAENKDRLDTWKWTAEKSEKQRRQRAAKRLAQSPNT